MAVLKLTNEDDPKEIADYLVQEHGLIKATTFARDGVATANDINDYYALSIWREVRVILEKRH
jgi:hypothetical protein